MPHSPKKHAAYRKVCDAIGVPMAEFADHLRQVLGEKATSCARVVLYNPARDVSYVVTVAAAACDRRGDEEFVLAVSESGGRAAPPGEAGAPPTPSPAGKKMLFKGRVQLTPSPTARRLHPSGASARAPSGGRIGAGGSAIGAGGRRGRSGRPEPRAPRTAGLSSIAGVCMLCAVAAAGGIAFYASYMSQVADHGTIEVIRAEIIDIEETAGGRLLDLELFASHTSCVRLFSDALGMWRGLVLYEEGDGCDRHIGAGQQHPGVETYATSTGVHIVLSDFPREADDREWAALEIVTDTASIVHMARIAGA